MRTLRIGSGITAALIFIMWAADKTPGWTSWLWITLGTFLMIDWALGGVKDRFLWGKREK